MARRTSIFSGLAGFIIAASLAAQQPASVAKLRKLGLPEASGSVPVIYVASAKDRALRLQKALQRAHSWYEEQLHLQVPIVLEVLDSETGGNFQVPYSFGDNGTGIIVVPANPTGVLPAGHEGWLQYESTEFHEDGHILAHKLNIASGNAFINELVAQMFRHAYIAAERPDMNWELEDFAWYWKQFRPSYTPRYTSLADLDYLYTGMGMDNYVWFQQQGLAPLAGFLVKGQSFPAVIEKLQKAFPAALAKQEALEEIISRLEGVRPGFRKAAGSLAGPTTIPPIMPSACPELTKRTAPSQIAVRNETGDPVVIKDLDGRDSTLPTHSWRSYQVPVGSSLKLPDGTCLVARDEPTLAVIGKQ